MEYCKLEMKLKELTGLREKGIIKNLFATLAPQTECQGLISTEHRLLIFQNHGLRRRFAEK